MKSVFFRALMILELGLFFSCSIADEKHCCGSVVDMFNAGDVHHSMIQMQPSSVKREQILYVLTKAINATEGDSLTCKEEAFLVAESNMDSLFCLRFFPEHHSDCIWAFPSHPATYPKVSPIEKSQKALEDELRMQLDEYRTVCNALQSVLVVFDVEGLPRGLIMFGEEDQKDVIVRFGEEMLGYLKQEKFSPGIDVEVEVGSPVPDIMEIRLN